MAESDIARLPDENQSEVARILDRIGAEYEASYNGLHGPAAGGARHAFITARMENMHKLQEQLQELIGDQAIGLVAVKLDELGSSGGATPQ